MAAGMALGRLMTFGSTIQVQLSSALWPSLVHKCSHALALLSTEAYSWLKPRVAGVAPAPRYHHVMELSADGRIIVFGG